MQGGTPTSSEKGYQKTNQIPGTYKTNSGAKDRAGRESIQATDYRFKALNQFGIAVSDIAKFFSLIAKYSKDFFSGFACINL